MAAPQAVCDTRDVITHHHIVLRLVRPASTWTAFSAERELNHRLLIDRMQQHADTKLIDDILHGLDVLCNNRSASRMQVSVMQHTATVTHGAQARTGSHCSEHLVQSLRSSIAR